MDPAEMSSKQLTTAAQQASGAREQARMAESKPRISNVELFTYHKPDDQQILALDMVRGGAIALADTIEQVCPPSADRSAAIRKLRECVHVAAASIMLKGGV